MRSRDVLQPSSSARMGWHRQMMKSMEPVNSPPDVVMVTFKANTRHCLRRSTARTCA